MSHTALLNFPRVLICPVETVWNSGKGNCASIAQGKHVRGDASRKGGDSSEEKAV